MAFLYLMTACWMSECTLMLPSPHGTTTRVLPKHTVTFMAPCPDGGASHSEANPGAPLWWWGWWWLKKEGRETKKKIISEWK